MIITNDDERDWDWSQAPLLSRAEEEALKKLWYQNVPCHHEPLGPWVKEKLSDEEIAFYRARGTFK